MASLITKLASGVKSAMSNPKVREFATGLLDSHVEPPPQKSFPFGKIFCGILIIIGIIVLIVGETTKCKGDALTEEQKKECTNHRIAGSVLLVLGVLGMGATFYF